MQTPAAAAAAAAAGLGRAGYPFTPLCPSKPSHQRKTFTIDSLLSASATSPSPSYQSQGLACCPAAGCVLGATLAVPALARAPAAVYPSLLYPRAAHPVYYGAPFLYRPATDACTLTRCPHDYPLAKSPFPTRQKPGKAKRARTIFTHEQLARLEKEFARQQYMVGSERFLLASTLQLNESQVKVWFQNRRIKWRKQSLEQQQANLARIGMAETQPRPDSPGARDGSGSPRERRADPHPLAPPAGSSH